MGCPFLEGVLTPYPPSRLPRASFGISCRRGKRRILKQRRSKRSSGSQAQPQALFWVHYDPDEVLSPEAATFLEEAYRRGMNVRVLAGDSAPHLRSMPGALPRRPTTKHPVFAVSSRLEAQLAEVPHTSRVLALASILADLGMWNDAIDLVHGVGGEDPLAPNASKLAGRFQRQAGRPQLALQEFGWPLTTPGKLRLPASCSNELLAAGLEARRGTFLAANGLLSADQVVEEKTRTVAL